MMQERDVGALCRFCRGEGDDPYFGELISPCSCTGSMRYVHEQCLLSWIDGQLRHCITNDGQLLKCASCGSQFLISFPEKSLFVRAGDTFVDALAAVTPYMSFLAVGASVWSGMAVYGGVIYAFARGVHLHEMFQRRSPLQWFGILPFVPISLVIGQFLSEMSISVRNGTPVIYIRTQSRTNSVDTRHWEVMQQYQQAEEQQGLVDQGNQATHGVANVVDQDGMQNEQGDARPQAPSTHPGSTHHDDDGGVDDSGDETDGGERERESDNDESDDGEGVRIDFDGDRDRNPDHVLPTGDPTEFRDVLSDSEPPYSQPIRPFDIVKIVLRGLTFPIAAYAVGKLVYGPASSTLSPFSRFLLGGLTYEFVRSQLISEYDAQVDERLRGRFLIPPKDDEGAPPP